MSEHNELLPCPCCSGRAHLTKGFAAEKVWPHGTFYSVYCGICQLRQLFHGTAAEAAAAWNRRTVAVEPKQEMAAWLVDGGLIYALNEYGSNHNEINVTMVNGSRSKYACNVEAHRLVAVLSNADERKTDEQRVKHANLIGMAQSMDMFRNDMIEAGVIDDNVPPMFMTEAILSYIGKLRAGNLTDEQIRDAALEEAATECEREMMFPGGRQECFAHHGVQAAAKAIRALISKELK
jgi:hypothetical protein